MALSDTQLVLLSTASQREDGLLTQPSTLKGGAARKVAAKLLAHGLVEEVSVTSDQPCWRQADDGAPIGLKVTRDGLLAIGVEPETPKLLLQRPRPVPPRKCPSRRRPKSRNKRRRPPLDRAPGPSRPSSGPSSNSWARRANSDGTCSPRLSSRSCGRR